MRTRTLLAVAALVLALGAVAAYGFTQTGSGGHLREAWVSDTARDMNGNHHAPAVAEIDGESWVFAPISGNRNTTECGLVALSGANGSTRWTYPIPPRNCTIHAVADPAVADLDGDGEVEVLAATTEKAVVAADPQTGESVFRHNLSSYGYTRPLVDDFAPGGGREVVVADVKGRLFAIHANGTEAWNRSLGTTWANPALADFDADGEDELAVGSAPPGGGAVTLLEADGTTAWRRTLDGSVGWLATGRVEAEANGSSARGPSSPSGTRIVAATTDGDVVAYAGDGTRVWNHSFGRLAAVHAFGDGDGDGTAEVYAVDADGKLRALDAATGDVEWTTTLTTEDVQMTPPPALGDVDGDGSPELLAATNDGKVSVVEPATGEVTATYRRDVPIFKYPVTADLDDDGDDEAVVMYGDGRVVALDYAE